MQVCGSSHVHYRKSLINNISLTAGSALDLDGILSSSLFRRSASDLLAQDSPQSLDVAQSDSDSLARFPAISQGEHPSTGIPCFFLHPCETSAALSDILSDDQSSMTPFKVLECWFMIVGSVLDLR